MTTLAANGKYLTYTIQDANYSPNLAVDGDHVYVVWTQNDTSDEGDYYNNDNSLYLRRSADQGQTFAAPQKLAQNQTDGIGNHATGPGNRGRPGRLCLCGVHDHGRRPSTCGAPPITAPGSPPCKIWAPAPGGPIWWWTRPTAPRSTSSGGYTYRYSADGGASFTNPVVLMPWGGADGGHSGTQMALGPGDTKHFVGFSELLYPAYGWGDEDIFYRSYGPVAGALRPRGPEDLFQHH